MEIYTTARHFEMDARVREYLEKKLGKLERFFDHIMSVHVVLAVERYRNRVEIVLKAKREELTCKGEAESMYAAIDQAIDRLERQIKKAKEKRKSKRRPREEGTESFAGSSEPEESGSTMGRILKAQEHTPSVLSPEEAARELELRKKEFLVFIDAESDQVKVIYRRKDGNYGLIESAH